MSADVPLVSFWKTKPGTLVYLLSSMCVPSLSSIVTLGQRPFVAKQAQILCGSILFCVHHCCTFRTFTCENGGGGSTAPPHFARRVFWSQRQGRDEVHGRCWWKNTSKTKTLFIFSLALGILKRIRLMWCALFILVTWAIRSEIWDEHECSIWIHLAKGLSCLTYAGLSNLHFMTLCFKLYMIMTIIFQR